MDYGEKVRKALAKAVKRDLATISGDDRLTQLIKDDIDEIAFITAFESLTGIGLDKDMLSRARTVRDLGREIRKRQMSGYNY
jgi:acyl carrier protein